MQTWIVQVNRSILGPVVPQARPKGGKFKPARQLPDGLRQYLNLPDDKNARPVMRDFKTLEELDAIALDECLVRRTVRKHGRILTVVLPQWATPARTPSVPKGIPAVRNLRQLCAYFGADDARGLNRRVYKDTECGASISVRTPDGTWHHNGGDWSAITDIDAFTIQTIVEGSDAEVNSDTFVLPVRESAIKHWIADMEAEADRLWHDANDDNEGEE